MSTKQIKKRIDEIKLLHREIASRVEERLAEFRRIGVQGDDCALFIELVFCLLTPQSGARRCGQAVQNLLGKECLMDGSFEDICPELNIVRFKNNKTRYILEARDLFMGPGKSLRAVIERFSDVFELREWIANNVKGLGYKEASHFLRNIGFGESFAILDRHILRNMVPLGLIRDIPASISPRRYIEMEHSLRHFSDKIGIPLAHLDFVLWYRETGDIFK